METNTHRILDFFEHLWPWFAGVLAFTMGGFKLWWSDRRVIKNRIQNLEILAQNVVTKPELHNCREDVRQEDEENLIRVLGELKELGTKNQRQYEDIMKQIIELHKK